MKRVELVSTGSELLSGRTVNRHAHTLGNMLRPLGFKLLRDTTVADSLEEIQDAVASACSRVDILFVTGGLGPTCDDLTRDALARFLGRNVVMDQVSLEYARERYRQNRRTLSPPGERQAQIVEGAVALRNSVGAAPGERIAWGEKVIFLLPGPPREFAAVLQEHVLPWLKENVEQSPVVEEAHIMVTGIGESDVIALFAQHGLPTKGAALAYCAAPGRVEIRISSPSLDREAVEKTCAEAKSLLGTHIFADCERDLAEVVLDLLRAQRATLATAESCTGGFLGHRLTSFSGSSDVYVGGVIAYANEIKESQLGVTRAILEAHGAVSEQVARRMAEGARKRFHAEYGIGITGIAGPTGGSSKKPVGLVYIAIADADGRRVKGHRFPGDRFWVKEGSSQMALDLLRRRLRGIV